MPSKARSSLDENLKDVERLLDLHTKEGGTSQGRRYGLAVLNKSAIVLTTSYWEAYCEDIAAEALAHIIANAQSADRVPKGIKRIVAEELKEEKNELAVWALADTNWRGLLVSRLPRLSQKRNMNMNTPKSEQIDKLFQTTLGIDDVSSSWHWHTMSCQKAKAKLNRYVTLRCEIAHRGTPTTRVLKGHVTDYLRFIKMLAAKTGGRVNKFVRSSTGLGLW